LSSSPPESTITCGINVTQAAPPRSEGLHPVVPGHDHREISDMIASLICHGTLTRFPGLRIASIENGSAWIRGLIEDLVEGMAHANGTSGSTRPPTLGQPSILDLLDLERQHRARSALQERDPLTSMTA
jgi:hypothetical protein